MQLLLGNGAIWAEKNNKGVSAEDLFRNLPELLKQKIPGSLWPGSELTRNMQFLPN